MCSRVTHTAITVAHESNLSSHCLNNRAGSALLGYGRLTWCYNSQHQTEYSFIKSPNEGWHSGHVPSTQIGQSVGSSPTPLTRIPGILPTLCLWQRAKFKKAFSTKEAFLPYKILYYSALLPICSRTALTLPKVSFITLYFMFNLRV